MIFFVLSLFFSDGFIENMNDLDLYRPEMATVWQWEENYLFFEYSPAQILKVSPNGKVIARFNKEGDGPEEIMRPVPLGFDDDHLFVVSHGHRIHIFDKDLNLTQRKMPSLRSVLGPSIVWQGVKLEDSSFVLLFGSTGLHHSHGLMRVKHGKSGWKVLSRYFPFDIAANNKNLPLPNAKNPKWQFGGSTIFKLTSTVLVPDENYEVLIYPKPWETDAYEVPIGGMFANVEDLRTRHKKIRCFPSHLGILKEGYVVQIFFNQGEIAHDYFDKDGGFIRREFDDYHIIPVSNANKTLKFTSDGDVERLFFMK